MIEITGKKKLTPFIYRPQGDKSISHRIAILGAISGQTVNISNFSGAKDCLTTLNSLRTIGASIENVGSDVSIKSWNPKGEEVHHIDCENSGTTARLLPSILGGLNVEAELTGDHSLRKRPMGRLIEPLKFVGARINDTNGKMPLKIQRDWKLTGKRVTLKIASAQLKSALLLAALFCEGSMEVIEPKETRDHTERMLVDFGVRVDKYHNKVTVKGKQQLRAPKTYYVTGDFSSAAYFIALGILSDKKIIDVKDVGLNPTRTGFLRITELMGAKISVHNKREVHGEPMGDLEIFPAKNNLRGIDIPEELVPNLIDELPLIAVIAAFSKGKTKVTAASELRVKESDRITSIITCLRKMGVDALELEDGFEITGGNPLHGSELFCSEDHRIIMSMTIAALLAEGKTKIIDSNWVSVSNSQFFNDIKKIAPESFSS
ncbi:3-phosphoshikimate 1-carboxyvinyltransferase [Alkalicella caledoniensis]|uniref:3-phosphoshikimate 1-carboxyvinyltransferase n=1 Tax=Alkalicella caledoniensis TaxID=2731377 RepID=A0A7G9WCB6_ALKCA|nr:3-phosphoshikimate 1-carboxyvinyltransferase [Alkalicella caledoniensis]QNO16328.1 3-phosphoshikimate 1-carboxyvinyltransferase [Alkalicella caledoniensis]